MGTWHIQLDIRLSPNLCIASFPCLCCVLSREQLVQRCDCARVYHVFSLPLLLPGCVETPLPINHTSSVTWFLPLPTQPVTMAWLAQHPVSALLDAGRAPWVWIGGRQELPPGSSHAAGSRSQIVTATSRERLGACRAPWLRCVIPGLGRLLSSPCSQLCPL